MSLPSGREGSITNVLAHSGIEAIEETISEASFKS
jgi:hypothetical protein